LMIKHHGTGGKGGCILVMCFVNRIALPTANRVECDCDG
jgi:hypothetical protein